MNKKSVLSKFLRLHCDGKTRIIPIFEAMCGYTTIISVPLLQKLDFLSLPKKKYNFQDIFGHFLYSNKSTSRLLLNFSDPFGFSSSGTKRLSQTSKFVEKIKTTGDFRFFFSYLCRGKPEVNFEGWHDRFEWRFSNFK